MAKTELFARRQVGGSFVYTDESKTTGNIFFVNSNTGTDGSGYGQNPDQPVATIDYAVGLCTANKGDRIYVMSDHAETITGAAPISIDVAGVSIIGLGQGSNRPTITFGTATTAAIKFLANNCRLSNVRCVANVDSLVNFVQGATAADDETIDNCDFIGASTKEALCAISIPTTFDNWTIRNCRFIQPTDPAGSNAAANTGAIYLVDSENVLIDGCEFRGYWETAFIHNKTTAAANLWVNNCYGICSLSDAQPFLLVSTATGGVRNSAFITPAETQVTEATLSGTFGAGFFNFQTYYGNDGGGGQLAVAGQAAAT